MDLSNRNLPATPKSGNDQAMHSGDEFSTKTIGNENENAVDSETIGDDEKAEYEYSEDYDDSVSADDEQRFVLAPTPAQLGRAPLQRRLGTFVGGDAHSMWKFVNYIINLFILEYFTNCIEFCRSVTYYHQRC